MDQPSKARVFIPLPTYSNPDWAMTGSLLGAQLDLYVNGIYPDIRFLPPNCYLDLMRNVAAYTFLKTDCTHLFFWDTDVLSPAAALRRLLAHDRDITIAPYPKKVSAENKKHNPNPWPIRLVSGEPDERGLLEAEMVATGFLLIKRHVIETLYELHKDQRSFLHNKEGDELIVDIFPTGLLDFMPKMVGGHRGWWGEDYAFSVLARNAGFKVWLDPNIPLAHVGRQVWRGDFTKNADDADAS
jgi:hypothetical protein